ncbi:hypothetical protein Tco_0615610 [Tanacetum coccineum]
MVVTRLHQPWRAILSVLNKCLTEKDSSWDTVILPILQILWGIVHCANLDFTSLIWDEFEWQTVERSSRPSKMSKLLYTRFTKLILDYLHSLNKMESKKAKIIDKLKEQHVSPIKSGRGKGFICYGDQVENAPNKLKKNVVPRKIRSLTIVEEAVVGELAKSISIQEPRSQRCQRSQLTIDSQTDKAVADMYNEWGQKLKGPAVEDLAVQSLLDLQKGSKASRLESLRQKKQLVVGEGLSAAQNKYYSSSDTDIDATLSLLVQTNEREVKMKLMTHMNLIWTYPMIIHINMMMMKDFIQTLLDKTPTNASEVLLGTHVDVLATKTLMHEMFPDENAYRIPSLPAKKIPYPTSTPQSSSLQKFKEYDQKLEALTNFNFSEAFEKVVQAKVLTEIKKLLHTHILNAIANYVKPRLNTSVLESNDTHTTHQQLYDTLYESIILDQDELDAQAAQSSFHKRSHDNQDPPNNCEGENKKKHRKDVDEPSSRSSRQNISLVVIVEDDTPAMKPLDQADILIQKHSKLEWFLKKSGLATRSMTWFDLFLRSDIDKDENHILRQSTIAIAKKFKELI